MNRLSRTIFFLAWVCSFSIGQAADLTQDRWRDFMTKNMPSLFCKPDQYYRECYEVTPEECQNAVAFAVEACIADHIQELPDIFTYTDSRRWGAVIEKCVDAEYTITFGNQKIDTDACKEIK